MGRSCDDVDEEEGVEPDRLVHAQGLQRRFVEDRDRSYAEIVPVASASTDDAAPGSDVLRARARPRDTAAGVTQQAIHLGQQPDPATLEALADFICGDDDKRFPVYRSSTRLTRFFHGIGINATHDGSTRKWWVLEVLQQLEPSGMERVILRLVDLREYRGDQAQLGLAVRSMNGILAMENLGIGFAGATPELRRASGIELDEHELAKEPAAPDEAAFLEQRFSEDLRIDELGLDSVITGFLQARVDEVQACPRDKVSLGTIILLGSTLEGLLLAVGQQHPKAFMSSSAAPKDRTATTKKLHEWSLSELINVAHALDLLDVDVSKFSHVLRDFRNYIHPYHQMSQRFSPNQHTVDICWQVFRAAYSQLKARKAKLTSGSSEAAGD